MFSMIDYLVPKSNRIWVFPVYFLGRGALCDNNLAVLGAIDPDLSIKCFIRWRFERPVSESYFASLEVSSSR